MNGDIGTAIEHLERRAVALRVELQRHPDDRALQMDLRSVERLLAHARERGE